MKKLVATILAGAALATTLAGPAYGKHRLKPQPPETDPVPCICLPAPDIA